MFSNVPSCLFKKSCDAVSSFPTNRSTKPSLSMSVQTAFCELVAGTASPLDAVTSVKVPSQLFRSSERR